MALLGFQYLLYGLGVFTLFQIIQIPFWFLGSLFEMVFPGSAILPVAFGFLLLLWLSVFPIFTIPGMLLNDRNIFQAFWDSIRIVQWNFAPTIGFLVILTLLDITFTRLWISVLDKGWLTFGRSRRTCIC